MASASGRSLRTTVVGVLLVTVCALSAGKLLLDAERARSNEGPATVESIVFIEQGERAAVPRVTASFEFDGQTVEATFVDAEARLATGDRFIIRFDGSAPADAVPTWQDDVDRGAQRFLAVCLAVAAVLAAALVRTEREPEEPAVIGLPSGALAT